MDNNLGVTEVQWTVLNGSKLWSKGALFQGNRLISVLAQMENIHSKITTDPNNFFLYADQLKELNDLLKYEEEFFVLALYNTVFFLSHAANTFAGFRKVVDEIESVNGVGYIKDVRDMRVHIDEYSKGKGGKNKDNARFVYESPDELYPAKPFADHLFAADATSTIILPDAYLIGGRINLQKTMLTLERLLPDITQNCDKHMQRPQNS